MCKPTVLVSSSVYGQESLLDQIYAVLSGYGYDVWMSHKGTIPLDSSKTAFANCIAAVEECNIVLGLINGRYGSGKEDADISITHKEILKAIELGKTRFFAVHHDVIIARHLLRKFRLDENGVPHPPNYFSLLPVLDDIRILDLYDAATRSDLALKDRNGNWVHKYTDGAGLLKFIESQFANVERNKKILGI